MPLVLPSGLLNRRIRIEKRSEEMSGGQLVDGWTPHLTCWAQVNPKNSLASNPADGVARSIGTYVFRIRYRASGIDAGMRVIYQEQYFEVTGVIQDIAGHIYTDVVCQLGGAGG